MVDVFKDDEAGYRAWLTLHPAGFVLNCERSPRPAYLMLHSSTCSTISREPSNGKLWTKDYIKICGDQPADIERWIRDEVGRASAADCQRCLR